MSSHRLLLLIVQGFLHSPTGLSALCADVVKTRLQTQGSLHHNRCAGFFVAVGPPGLSCEGPVCRYKGVTDAIRKIYAEEGAMAFTKGLGPRIAYLAPSAAITFTLYEGFKRAFSLRWFDGSLHS